MSKGIVMKHEPMEDFSTPLGVIRPIKINRYQGTGNVSSLQLNPQEEWNLKFPWGYQKTPLEEIQFYEGGGIKALELGQRGQLDVSTPVGSFPVTHRIEFWPKGYLKSFDPSVPVKIPTPIGPVDVFGGQVNFPPGENPICMDPEGQITRIYTSMRAIELLSPSKTLMEYLPTFFWESQSRPLLLLQFDQNLLSINNQNQALPQDQLICFFRDYQPLSEFSL